MKFSILKNIFILLILSHLIFLIPLSISSLLLYRSYVNAKQLNLKKVETYILYAKPFVISTNISYVIPHTTLSLLHISKTTDSYVDLINNVTKVMEISVNSIKNIEEIKKLVLNKNKSETEQHTLNSDIQLFKDQLIQTNILLSLIKSNMVYLPYANTWSLKINDIQKYIDVAVSMVPYSDELFGKNEPRRYLILFLNNNELRPGGGFIGSYAILTLDRYTLKELVVHDVYDADGQLQTHFDPPEPVHKYLLMPNWYLRDSNFSANFSENAKIAEFFLDQETGEKNFYGVIGLTTTAIGYLLEGFGNVYVPDFNDTVNKDNFYLKTQSYVEEQFFSGSIQKKSFISSLLRNIMLNIGDVSMKDIIYAIKKSLDEKQMILDISHMEFQNYITKFGWDGNIPKNNVCSNKKTNCINDIVYPIDANVGANKSNYFVSRSLHVNLEYSNDQTLHHLLTIQYKNDSSPGNRIGGIYKNYLQLYLPKNIEVTKIFVGNIPNESYKQVIQGDYKIVSFYFEVAMESTQTVKIEYNYPITLENSTFKYLLTIPKQVGTINNDAELTFKIPQNLLIVDQNHNAFVNKNEVTYKENILHDISFIIDFKKNN